MNIRRAVPMLAVLLLVFPIAGNALPSKPYRRAVLAMNAVVPKGEGVPYQVQRGDTVAKLAVIFLTSEREIRRVNGKAADWEVRPGEKILIPAPKDP
jgi:LysM domain